MIESVKEEFYKKFGKDTVFSLELTKDDVPKWDSLRYIAFLVSLEKKFDIKFTPESASTMKTIDDILKYIKQNQP